jgi:plasmid replication initiation protein
VYEKRVLYRILEAIQYELEGQKIPNVELSEEFFDVVYRMPVTHFMVDGDDENYTRIKQAVKRLRERTIEIHDNGWIEFYGVIEKPKLKERGWVTFKIDKKVHALMMNFVKGFRRYELKTAMSFKSEYSMRLYELMSGQKQPLTYTIAELKKMFGVDKNSKGKPMYKRPGDFIKRIIETAKNELDKKSPYSFEYEINKRGKEFYSITFYPVFIRKNSDANLAEQELNKTVDPVSFLGGEMRRYLIDKMGFTVQQVKNNENVFIDAKTHIPDILSELANLTGKMRDKKNPQGYVINALRGKIKDAKEAANKKRFDTPIGQMFDYKSSGDAVQIGKLMKGYKSLPEER